MKRFNLRPSALQMISLAFSLFAIFAAVTFLVLPKDARYEAQLETARFVERSARSLDSRHVEKLARQWGESARSKLLDQQVENGELAKIQYRAKAPFDIAQFFDDVRSFTRTNNYQIKGITHHELNNETNLLTVWVEAKDRATVQKHIFLSFPDLQQIVP